ncbi:hypothetical protein Q1695_014347 [Nippostrongylus brasiliensis]|nr:hypothetical protein Q1695_014347 [Nippostrongylus brasiliensis]
MDVRVVSRGGRRQRCHPTDIPEAPSRVHSFIAGSDVEEEPQEKWLDKLLQSSDREELKEQKDAGDTFDKVESSHDEEDKMIYLHPDHICYFVAICTVVALIVYKLRQPS